MIEKLNEYHACLVKHSMHEMIHQLVDQGMIILNSRVLMLYSNVFVKIKNFN